MSGFEFVFGLFGLLLGLALAEGLGGLAKALKASHRVRIGWPTALLGLFVSCDVVTFWMYGWSMRERLPVSWPVLFAGFLVAAVSYISTSLIFPDDPDEWQDLGAHFDKHHKKVLAGVAFCNVVLLGTAVALLGAAPFLTLRTLLMTWSFFPVVLLALLTRDRRVTVGCLILLIAFYPLAAFWAP